MAISHITPPSGDRQHVPTDQAAPELFPCPFCGGNNVRVFGPIGWYRQFGISHSCQAFHGGSGDFTVGAHSREEATSAWNRRAASYVQQAKDHRSFPDAADGRPMPPMGDELMTAGLNGDDARFVAIQLAQNGLRLTPAPSAPAEVEGLVERLMLNTPVITQDHKDAATVIMPQAATALTALQAENERLALLLDLSKKTTEAVLERAEKAEAALADGLDACDQFDGPVSSSEFVNGQATCAQQIRAKLKGEV